MLKYLLAVVALLCLLSPAEARHRHYHHRARHPHMRAVAAPACADIFCWFGQAQQPANPRLRQLRDLASNSAGQIVGSRPAGCPHAFCGCGLSLHRFGRIIPSLNLAANWLRFPRAAPGPGMVAVRSHHVMGLEQHLGGDVWLVHDSNSGHGLTRIHARSIAGYTIVNPAGGA